MRSIPPSGPAMAGRSLPLLVVFLLAACGPLRRGPAVPFEVQDRALIPGLTPAARTWAAAMNPEFEDAVVESVRREQAELNAAGHTGRMPRAEYLALSGGGPDGAFGAGLLCGWTAKGDRPSFKLVTGISTGALIAPFAFLGPEYDYVLRDVYTKTSTKDIMKQRGLIAGLTSDALADTKPLWVLLEKYFDEEMMNRIAAEYAKGRLLVIGTTNLDARRAVLWNVGEIAASDYPDKLHLIRSILIASASIPAAFPPVFVDVEVDGEKYQEMHVDGGAMTQVFVYPPTTRLAELAAREGAGDRERRAFIIRNSRVDPEWAQTDRRTLTIAQRAISSLIATQGVGDLFRIYMDTQRDGVDFNLAFIPRTFTVEAKEAFDPVYMSQLFQVGYDLAVKGYPWEKVPPYYGSVPGAPSPSSGTTPASPTAAR